MLTTGTLSGPTEVQIRGRSGAVSAWLWCDGSAAQAMSTSA
jgi:adenylate cyclase